MVLDIVLNWNNTGGVMEVRISLLKTSVKICRVGVGIEYNTVFINGISSEIDFKVRNLQWIFIGIWIIQGIKCIIKTSTMGMKRVKFR